jgi:ketosteroid isomerase-like protein
MTASNVEVVQGFYEAVNRWLDSYWADPGQPPDEAPGWEELMDRIDPETEWDWLFSPETFRGPEELLHAVRDWLETVSDWRIEVEEVIEGSGDRVLANNRIVARGKGSGTPVIQRVFAVITVRSGRIARIQDHTERAEGFEAAGLSSAGLDG